MDSGKSEFGLIEWIRRQRPAALGNVPVDIGDDMAVVEVGGEKVLITTDILLEGVHFDLGRCSLEQVGYKALAVSLSDCAAMAAVPLAAVAAVALPNGMSMENAQELYSGLQKAAERFGCPIVGGDTTSWDRPLAIDVTMLAKEGACGPVLRSGAKAGDVIMVTGELGGSSAGRHLEFAPRVAEAQILAGMVELHAMIDLSDGLASDLGHVCRESGVAAEVDVGAVPISEAARRAEDPLRAALTDGEDFELLFCVSPGDAEKLAREWAGKSALRITQIGCIMEAKGNQRVYLRYEDGNVEPLTLKGWEHFRER